MTVPRGANPNPTGVQVYRRALRPCDIARQRGIPVTTPLQTLIDCATVCERPEVERLINEADARNLLRVDVLREELRDRERQRGAPVVRDILDRDLYVLTHTELERLFVPIARKAGLEKPQSRVYVNGHRVDFYFPSLDLVVECDSLRYHRTAYEQRKDRLRDQAHDAAGTPYTRYTHFQIAYEREYVAGNLAAIAARLSPRASRPGRPRAA